MLTLRPGARAGVRRPRRDTTGQDGLTLVELLMAMAIFSVVVIISGAMLHGMTQATVRVTSINDSRSDVDRLYNRLDKQVPYASFITEAAQSGGDWWVEFRTDVPAGGLPPRCWQYRLNAAERVVESRTWQSGAPATVSDWSVLLQNAEARVGVPPFRTVGVSENFVRQQLVIALDVAAVGAPNVPLDTAYVARNRAENTTGTCTEVGRS